MDDNISNINNIGWIPRYDRKKGSEDKDKRRKKKKHDKFNIQDEYIHDEDNIIDNNQEDIELKNIKQKKGEDDDMEHKIDIDI